MTGTLPPPRRALANVLVALRNLTPDEAGTVVLVWQGDGAREESTLLAHERRALIALRQAGGALERAE